MTTSRPAKRLWEAAIALAIAVGASTCDAATITLGPGAVSTPYESYQRDEFLVLPGTEIVAHDSALSSNGQTLVGGHAIQTYGSKWVFQGGHVEGATVTTVPGVPAAAGGPAIEFGSPSFQNYEIYDGVFRGGSVILKDPAPPLNSVRGGTVFSMHSQNATTMKIYGGLFEGGAVSLESSPGTAIARALALNFSSSYGGLLDISGGTFVGGIQIASPTTVKIHGTELNVQPAPVDGRIVSPAQVTISGKYSSGVPFSHSVAFVNHPHQNVTFGPDFVIFSVPEPSSGLLALIVSLPMRAFRRRRSDQIVACEKSRNPHAV